MYRRRLFVLPILGLMLFAACSGPSQSSGGQTSGPAPSDRDPSRTDPARVALAQYETFDVTAYSVRPPEQTVEITHQVPRRLMRGRADKGVKQTVEGFRIQVYSAQDQEASQEFRERVRQWWKKVQADAPQDLFRSQPPIVIEYSQPYYRVRIGAFADRDAATEALEFVREEYSGAFVARSTVTVIR